MPFKLSWLLRSSSTVASLSKELEAASIVVAQLQAENADLHALVASLRESTVASLPGKIEATQADAVLPRPVVENARPGKRPAPPWRKMTSSDSPAVVEEPCPSTQDAAFAPPPCKMASSDSPLAVVEDPCPSTQVAAHAPPPCKMASSGSPLAVIEEPCPGAQDVASALGDTQPGRRH